jgi:NAD(P)-dependent dehydrogenase (short-subunit alcohol dehydrogenase family)
MTESARPFAGRRVLITGGTAGIGRATAVAFGAAGAHVIVVGRSAETGPEVVAQITGAGGTAEFRAVDLASADGTRELVTATGPVDVLVTSAGFRPPPGPAVATTAEDLETTWAVNVRGPWLLSAGYGPTMPADGAIVHVSSANASRDQEGFGAYNVSKAAVDALVRAFAHELGHGGVRVNAVAPGPTYTPYTEQFGAALEQLMEPTPLGRPGTAEQVAAAILFLAGPGAAHITGAVLPVDGGQVSILR